VIAKSDRVEAKDHSKPREYCHNFEMTKETDIGFAWVPSGSETLDWV
jgi:hypothetical protein